MKAVVTKGNGGFEQLSYHDVPIPKLGSGEVLVQVLAAGVNNTDINTRLGWYASSVTSTAEELDANLQVQTAIKSQGAGSWNEEEHFPLIQGTDCCGRVRAIGDCEDHTLIGARVLIRPCKRVDGWNSLKTAWMGCDFDGAFAQFVKIPVEEVFRVNCNWSDAELGAIPCAYGTAENMLHRADVKAMDDVLVTGGSGGVGTAVVQLCKSRGAVVTAIAGEDKHARIKKIGADRVVGRDEDIVALLGKESVGVVVDNVAGAKFGSMLKVLKKGGIYVSSGAIAGPIVSLDMRDMYLKDITLIGCTAWAEPVFPNLISYIERGEFKPVVEGTFPLTEIADVQRLFSRKKHVGKYVLIPPKPNDLQEKHMADV